MTDLSIITFSQQGDNIPISIVSSTPQIPGITLSNLGHQHVQYTESSFDSTAIPIHVVDATFNDSIYMMLHNISDTPILTQVFQQDGDQTKLVLIQSWFSSKYLIQWSHHVSYTETICSIRQ